MPSNKRMQLTKLRAAPERQGKVPPCAPAGGMDGGTASQLIRSVRQLVQGGVPHERSDGSRPTRWSLKDQDSRRCSGSVAGAPVERSGLSNMRVEHSALGQ